jgi:hypothetical protein
VDVRKKIFPLVVLALAVVVDGFFGLANFYPEAPAHARGPKQLVLADMPKARAQWFQENVLDELNDEIDSNLELRVLGDKETLLDALAKKDPTVVAAILPKATADLALEKSFVRPFEGAFKRAALDHAFDDLRPEAMTGAQLNGKQAFLPRASTVDITVYRISRVRDAILHWEAVRPQIDAAIREANGRGLPPGYTLQENPRLWDSYDRFVLAFYWAHRSYNGFPARPRVGHPTGDGLDGQLEASAGIYRAGADEKTFVTPDSMPATDHFSWESLYAKQKLFLPEMMDKAPLGRHHMISGLQTGDLFVADVDLASAFEVRGGSFYGALTYIQDPDDLGFVVLPRFSSLALNGAGQPERTARSFSFRNDLVWALPASSKDPGRALALAKWLVQKENHVRDCEALGYVPMRKDVFREVDAIFRNYWMSAAFDAAVEQWPRSQSLPAVIVTKQLGSIYAELWHQIVQQPGGSLFGDKLVAQLKAPPAGRALPETALHGALKAPPDSAAKEGAFAYPKIDEAVVIDLLDGGAAPLVDAGAGAAASNLALAAAHDKKGKAK